MAGLQIPGLSYGGGGEEPKKEEPVPEKEKTEEYSVFIDAHAGSVVIMKHAIKKPESVDTKRYVFLQNIDESQVMRYGQHISDEFYDENTDIHCDVCDKFYRPFCREHPLFHVPDRRDDMLQENTEPGHLDRSKNTCPALFAIRKSKIPNAGQGVFAKMLIPTGFMFGPYEGVRCETKHFKVDGYAWEIADGDKTFYIDGSIPEYSNWLRYINSPRNEEEQNLIAFQVSGRVYYRVIKPVMPDDELLVWYGANYGKNFIHKCFKSAKKPRKNQFIL